VKVKQLNLYRTKCNDYRLQQETTMIEQFNFKRAILRAFDLSIKLIAIEIVDCR